MFKKQINKRVDEHLAELIHEITVPAVRDAITEGLSISHTQYANLLQRHRALQAAYTAVATKDQTISTAGMAAYWHEMEYPSPLGTELSPSVKELMREKLD